MSAVLYPISALIADLRVAKFNRVIGDEFDAGNTSTRRYWGAQNFKRRFTLKHTPLTVAEFECLHRFYDARDGRYDSFFFRDPVKRLGNALVRFGREYDWTSRPTALTDLEILLEEVAPIRALPNIDDVTTAAGAVPLFWFDANRETYLTNVSGNSVATSAFDGRENYPAPWITGAMDFGSSQLGQYQHYYFSGSNYAKSASNVSIAGTQPACTLFAIAKHGGMVDKQVLFGIGAKNTGAALGIAIAADNRYEPWLGGAETFTNARFNNSADETWRSVAVTWASASNDAKLYVNGALIGTDTVTRALTAGPVVLGAAFDGTLPANPGGGETHANLNHIMGINAALTLAQVKALHNLFAYQYGMATVA